MTPLECLGIIASRPDQGRGFLPDDDGGENELAAEVATALAVVSGQLQRCDNEAQLEVAVRRGRWLADEGEVDEQQLAAVVQNLVRRVCEFAEQAGRAAESN